ncbi:CoA ester lyase [Alkalimonas sp.]|uniref:HpcH/HpaI aldolase/citrate lyase family protein n=1 Tax=Alkalimonas sp. TaxID=1872453 RepID=UPI00263A4277|nr:CoA ester lyase [Alkalimonas sp.]MCC5825068.1 CoA ester lyase [Alkalimonas sp.]
MGLIRSLLFVPGNRPDRFHKALASEADLICIDLEDAVPLAEKDVAFAAVQSFLAELEPSQRNRVAVRMNPLSTQLGECELTGFSNCPPAYLMLAKCQSTEEVERAARSLQGRSKLIGLIESLSGLMQAQQIARASKTLVALMFGGADLAAELGCDFSYEPLLLARCQLVQAAAVAGVQLLDVPFVDLQDLQGLQQETRRIRALGFSGKAAIHPKQIQSIHEALQPSAEQLTYARKVVAAALADSADAVLVVDGKMVDRPVLLSCQRILAYAGETAVDDTSCAH